VTARHEGEPPAGLASRAARRVVVTGGAGVQRAVVESLACERALRVVLDGRVIGLLACTPADLADLALGFLFGEAYIDGLDDLAALEVEGETLTAYARSAAGRDGVLAPAAASPAGLAARGTGCGRVALHDLASRSRLRPVAGPPGLSAAVTANPAPLLALFRHLQRAGPIFRASGGAHYAALAGLEHWGATGPRRPASQLRPAPALFFEDISRHSAIDKLAGAALRTGLDRRTCALLTSGRITTDAVARAARLGVPLLASRSAPTDLAVDLARSLGMVVVGFARGGRLNVY
jgi:FdhD protein